MVELVHQITPSIQAAANFYAVTEVSLKTNYFFCNVRVYFGLAYCSNYGHRSNLFWVESCRFRQHKDRFGGLFDGSLL